MTADKEHSQAVVADFVLIEDRLARRRISRGLLDRRDDCPLLVREGFLPSHDIQRQVLCRLRQPRRRIFRHAIKRPDAQGSRKRLLHHILRELEMIDAKVPRQCRDQLARFLAEEPLCQLRDFLHRRARPLPNRSPLQPLIG